MSSPGGKGGGGGWKTAGGKPPVEVVAARKAAKVERQKQVDGSLGKLSGHSRQWLDQPTSDGTRNVHGQGSHSEHAHEAHAKAEIKSGNFQAGLDHLNEAISKREKVDKVHGDSSHARYTEHLRRRARSVERVLDDEG